ARAGAKTELIILPQELGPLRSVQPAEINGKMMLLVGARSGVMRADPGAPNQCTLYRAEIGESQLGFSAAAVTRDRIWACHGEAGVIAWPINAPEEPAVIVRSDPSGVSISTPSPVLATVASPSLLG